MVVIGCLSGGICKRPPGCSSGDAKSPMLVSTLPTLETWIGDYASYITFQESHHESCSSVQISAIQTGIERTLSLQSPAPKYARANSNEQIQIALGVG